MPQCNYSMQKNHLLTRQQSHRYADVHMELPNHFRSIATEAFQRKNKIKTIAFPDTFYNIGARAFCGCASLKEIKLPVTLRSLGPGAFSDCISLEKIWIPASLSELPKDLFHSDRSLTEVIFAPNSQISLIRQDAFFGCAKLSSITLPDHLITLGARTFYRCRELKSVHFPSTLKEIGNQAFYFCGLTSLELPNSLEYLGESAFFKCSNLISVTIPPSVKHMGKWVFHGCNRLKYLEIHHDPEFIGEWIVNKATTIRCYKDSKMDRYCQETGFTVEYLDKKENLHIW